MMIKTEDTDYSRDMSSKALINTNTRALDEYKARKSQTNQINTLKEDFDQLKVELDEIKSLLVQLIKHG
jgi:hypothetical protein